MAITKFPLCTKQELSVDELHGRSFGMFENIDKNLYFLWIIISHQNVLLQFVGCIQSGLTFKPTSGCGFITRSGLKLRGFRSNGRGVTIFKEDAGKSNNLHFMAELDLSMPSSCMPSPRWTGGYMPLP